MLSRDFTCFLRIYHAFQGVLRLFRRLSQCWSCPMLISTPHSMLTWHSHITLCSPGITPITPHAHLAHLLHPMLTFTRAPYSLGLPLLRPMISCLWEHHNWELWNEPQLDMSGLTPKIPLQINLQITPRPDSEASHKTYLRCQPRHIMWGLNSKLSIRLFMAPTKIIEFIFHFKFSCWAVLPWGAHSLCAHSTSVPNYDMALAPCIKFSQVFWATIISMPVDFRALTLPLRW